MNERLVMVLTSNDEIGGESGRTGVWWEELAVPYEVFTDAGLEVTLSSAEGGSPPFDPTSEPDELEGPAKSAVEAFQQSEPAMAALREATPLGQLDPQRYAAAFLVGGHGTMGDFPRNPYLHGLLRTLYESSGVVAAICHGPAGFIGATDQNGAPLLKGHVFTCFTDEEEEQAGMKNAVPFSLQAALTEEGARFVGGDARRPKAVVSGPFVFGQNPESSRATAEAVLRTMRNLRSSAAAA